MAARRAVRGSWPALVLVVLLHVVGCAHGPLAGTSWRADTLTATATAAPPTVRHATGVAPVQVRPAGCEGHRHGPQQCAGVDEPVLGQPGGDKAGSCPPALPVAGAVPEALPVRGPPAGWAGSLHGDGRASLQVWRI